MARERQQLMASRIHGRGAAGCPRRRGVDYDAKGERSRIQHGNGCSAGYTYDGSGQRVRKVVVKGNIVETLTAENGSAVATPAPVLRYQPDDHLDFASLELDGNANVISYEEYYPYGDTSYQAGRSASEVSQKRYRYTGKEKDEESGLYCHGARYYACWLGRWTASDPAGLVDGVNLYMYVRGNPVNGVDSSGKWTDRDLLTRSGQNGMTQPDATSVDVPKGSSVGAISGSSISSSSGSSSASSATNSKSSSTAAPSKPTARPEWRQRESGFRERLDQEGGPISLAFKIGYDVAEDFSLSGQRFVNHVTRSDYAEFKLNGEVATNAEVQDAFVNVMLFGIPEIEGLSATGKALEKSVATEAKGTIATERTSLAYRPTSGVQLQAEEGKTTTILGSYNNDMKSVVDELGNIKSTDFGPREGSFNVLNVPDNMYVSPSQFWGDYNMPWLSNAIDRGDNFLMATKPAFDVIDLKSGFSILARPNPITGQMELSGFGREYLMMRRAGYNYREGAMVK